MQLENVLNELNNKQLEAVTSFGNPLLVLAPAGSGKTKVITYKILYLIEKKGFQPSKIVALTFTNKAANEMKSRICSILPSKGKYITASTFHSFGVKILRKYSGLLGYKENFSIYDYDDSISVINKIKKELSVDYDSKVILYSISQIKNSINSYDEYQNYINNSEFHKIIKQYIEYLKSHNAMDFDDILLNLFFILTDKNKDFYDVQEAIKNNIQYLLVDEYQDTNKIQYLIIKNLMNEKSNKNITIVGDDDQGIYSFRGSTIENILRFENDFSDCRIVCLEKNYRSSHIILHAAKNVINNNRNRKNKEMKTDIIANNKIIIYEAADPQSEAVFIYEKIHQLLYKDGIKHKDIAILYRNNHMARPIEELFIIKNLKHKVWGGYNFYSREEIRDISAYLFSLLNPYDEVSLLRIINVPKRGIGLKLIEKLVLASKNHQTHIFDILKIISDKKQLSDSILVNLFSENEIDSLMEFYDLMISYRQILLSKNCNFPDIFNQFIEKIGYREYLKNHNDERTFDIKIGYFESFLSSLFNYKNFEEDNYNIFSIAERLRLLMNNDLQEEDSDAINLMTMHSAKGLEFKVVFIIGAEKDIIPSNKVTSNIEYEEERRLFYVAMTRAKEYLFISYCLERNKFGKKYNCYPSAFIDEIPEEDKILDLKKIDANITANDIASIKNMILNKTKNSNI